MDEITIYQGGGGGGSSVCLIQDPVDTDHIQGVTNIIVIYTSIMHFSSFLYIKDVRANCFCASLLRTQFTSRCHATMPRHALNARAVEEMWRYIVLVATFNIYARV